MASTRPAFSKLVPLNSSRSPPPTCHFSPVGIVRCCSPSTLTMPASRALICPSPCAGTPPAAIVRPCSALIAALPSTRKRRGAGAAADSKLVHRARACMLPTAVTLPGVSMRTSITSSGTTP